MKTNKYITISLFAASIMFTTACKDSFLDVTNPTGEPLEEYYTTDAHIQEALIAAYDPIHWPDWSLGQYNALNIDAEIMGDNFWVGGANKADNIQWHKLFNYEGDANNTLSSLWTVDYSGVKRCNDLLKYLGWGKNLTDENKKSYEMQARTLRIYYYNNLWHYFGNIPFYLENLSNPYTAPQLKADDVYKQLITELETIINSNVLPMEWTSSQYGRVSQAMAYMMYAEIVMYQKDTSRYPQALEFMQKIIGDQHYGLMDNYSDIWKESGEWCKESIWEINYDDNNNERGWSSPMAIGGTVMPTLISPNGFHYLKDYGFDGDGWGFMPVRLETYNMFNPADKRRTATCWDVRGTTYTNRYQDTHIWLAKYIAQNANNKDAGFDANLNYNNNLRVYRFSETLLNAAELIFDKDPAAALGYFNQVHTRAGLPAMKSITLDDIINERRLEFVGEGKRYWDLVRTGKAASVLVPDSYGYRTNTWTEKKKYIPISQGELDSDHNLVQNDY